MADTIKPVTVTLSKPIEYNGKEYKEIKFEREAEVGDLIAADAISGEFGKMAALFASISGVPFPAFKRVTAGDMKRIAVAAGHLAGNDAEPETGEQ